MDILDLIFHWWSSFIGTRICVHDEQLLTPSLGSEQLLTMSFSGESLTFSRMADELIVEC